MFNNDIEALITQRFSHRSFEDKPIEESALKQICATAHEVKAPFENRVQIEHVTVQGDIAKELKELGAYGTIRGARSFIAGSGPVSNEGLVDFGYVFEHAILKATDLGLGSCWLGGSFNRSSFSSRLNLSAGSTIICISPIGVSLEKRPLRDRLIRLAVGAAKRKPWSDLFLKGGFGTPLKREDTDKYELALDMLRLAPSASNKQPWRVVRDDENRFHFFASHSTIYRSIMKRMNIPDLQLVDMGICMAHFQLAAGKLGFEGFWEKIPIKMDLPANTEYIASWIFQA